MQLLPSSRCVAPFHHFSYFTPLEVTQFPFFSNGWLTEQLSPPPSAPSPCPCLASMPAQILLSHREQIHPSFLLRPPPSLCISVLKNNRCRGAFRGRAVWLAAWTRLPVPPHFNFTAPCLHMSDLSTLPPISLSPFTPVCPTLFQHFTTSDGTPTSNPPPPILSRRKYTLSSTIYTAVNIPQMGPTVS